MKKKELLDISQMVPSDPSTGCDLKKESSRIAYNENEFISSNITDHKNVCIVALGIVVSFWENEDGTRTILNFKTPGEVLRPAIEVSEHVTGEICSIAYTDVDIIILDRKYLSACSLKSKLVSTFFYDLLTNDINSTYRQLKLLKQADLRKRYELFLDEYKHISNRISDRMIASYLGVHYTTLSRLKSKISHLLDQD